jgi:hypothetical protein
MVTISEIKARITGAGLHLFDERNVDGWLIGTWTNGPPKREVCIQLTKAPTLKDWQMVLDGVHSTPGFERV